MSGKQRKKVKTIGLTEEKPAAIVFESLSPKGNQTNQLLHCVSFKALSPYIFTVLLQDN